MLESAENKLKSKSQIKLEFLPLYPPKLNLLERVVRLVKSKVTHNRYLRMVRDLIWEVTEQFTMHAKPNSTLRES